MTTQWLRNLKDRISILSFLVGAAAIRTRTEFIKDERAILDSWVFVILGLFIIIVVYVLLVPITNMLAWQMIELGAPANPINWIRKMMAWGLGVMGAGLVIYGIMRSYKTTYDQGYER